MCHASPIQPLHNSLPLLLRSYKPLIHILITPDAPRAPCMELIVTACICVYCVSVFEVCDRIRRITLFLISFTSTLALLSFKTLSSAPLPVYLFTALSFISTSIFPWLHRTVPKYLNSVTPPSSFPSHILHPVIASDPSLYSFAKSIVCSFALSKS